MHGIPLNTNKVTQEGWRNENNNGEESGFIPIETDYGLYQDGQGIDDGTDSGEVESVGLEDFKGWGKAVFKFLGIIIEDGVEGFKTSSEFGKPVISAVILVLLELFSSLASFLRSLGISSVFRKTEFGFHDKPEDWKHDS